MKVVDCPKCGSSEIEKSSYSAEYMSSTRWKCEDCKWSYKKGSGMGTGSGNSGVHPRDVGPESGQSTLVQTGEWCRNCETCVVPDHGCRAEEHVERGEEVPKKEVIDALSEWHFRPRAELASSISDGELTLTPDFENVLYQTMENKEVWIDKVSKIVKQRYENNNSNWSDDMALHQVVRELDQDGDIANAVIGKALEDARDVGRLSKTKYGYVP